MTHFLALRHANDEKTGSDARLLELALNGVTSEHSRRSYRTGLIAFFAWVKGREEPVFTKALVQAYRAGLVHQGRAASTTNLRLAPIRKLAREMADNGMLDQHTAAAIERVPGVQQLGTRAGNWLTKEQANDLLNAPNPSKTEWHNLVAFNRTAEIVRDYCKKGKELFVEGKIQTRSWDDKESGQKRYRTEILVNDISFTGGGERCEGGSGGGNYSKASSSSSSSSYSQAAPVSALDYGEHGITDDDIPF